MYVDVIPWFDKNQLEKECYVDCVQYFQYKYTCIDVRPEACHPYTGAMIG